MNPFLVLNVPPDTTDEEVRAAYQRLVRRFPPEHCPEEFQLIQEAYQLLTTERKRWNWRITHEPTHALNDPLTALEHYAHLPDRAKPPGAQAFRTFLRHCASAALRDSTR